MRNFRKNLNVVKNIFEIVVWLKRTVTTCNKRNEKTKYLSAKNCFLLLIKKL